MNEFDGVLEARLEPFRGTGLGDVKLGCSGANRESMSDDEDAHVELKGCC